MLIDPINPQKAAAILRDYQQHETVKAIAEKRGVTKAHVRQLVRQHGVTRPNNSDPYSHIECLYARTAVRLWHKSFSLPAGEQRETRQRAICGNFADVEWMSYLEDAA